MLNTLTIENKDYVVVEKSVWQGIVDLAEDKCDSKWAMQMSDIINEQEFLPSEMVERILLHDENPLKVWREYRGYTGVELAKKGQLIPSTALHRLAVLAILSSTMCLVPEIN